MRTAARLGAALALGALLLPDLRAGAQEAPDPARAVRERIDALRSPDPFISRRAQAEIYDLGAEALVPLAPFVTAEDPATRVEAHALFDRILESLCLELDRELRSLILDTRELEELETRFAQARELEPLKSRLEDWKKEDPKIEERLGEYLSLKTLLETKESAGAPADEIHRLRARLEALRRDLPDIEAKAAGYRRLVALEAAVGRRPPGEVESLRAAELRERIGERGPRVELLFAVVRKAGPPAYSGLRAHLEFVPLQDPPRAGTVESPVVSRYRELLSGELERARSEGRLYPREDRFERERYALSGLWADEAGAGGERAEKAEAILDRHLKLVLGDLESPEAAVRERAQTELYRLGRRGIDALKNSQDGERHLFLLGLLESRVPPDVYRRYGIHFNDYTELSFRARRRRIFEFARVATRESVPALRAIVARDDLEPSFLVKYAAAKALVMQAEDRWGLLHLERSHPELVFRRLEISRDLLLLEGVTQIRARNYREAVERLSKLLERYPFDFEGNYHIAFAYLLLKEYAKAIHHFEIARRIRPRDQLTLYNLACAYSLAGRKDEALDTLEEAVDAGFHDAGHMEKDPDLDPLRGEERFRRILEKARQAS